MLRTIQYSFPSKTMEYLASGTPSIAYKLEGIPSEYYPFIIFPESNDVESLHNSILKVYRKYFSRRHVLSLRFFIFAVLIGMSNNKE